MNWRVLNSAGGGECYIHLLNCCETKRRFASVDWCRWADIKRIFHWGVLTSGFKCVKVSDLDAEHYRTQADYCLARHVA